MSDGWQDAERRMGMKDSSLSRDLQEKQERHWRRLNADHPWLSLDANSLEVRRATKDLSQVELISQQLRDIADKNFRQRQDRALLEERLDSKPTNPKDIIGSDKLPLHLWPESASAMGALALLDGALKYGRANFREIGVKASIYYDAQRRHMNKWFEGEDTDPDSGLPHLAHALACIAILIEASASGKLNDDRNYDGAGYLKLVEELSPHVARLKAKYADRDVKHYTIQS